MMVGKHQSVYWGKIHWHSTSPLQRPWPSGEQTPWNPNSRSGLPRFICDVSQKEVYMLEPFIWFRSEWCMLIMWFLWSKISKNNNCCKQPQPSIHKWLIERRRNQFGFYVNTSTSFVVVVVVVVVVVYLFLKSQDWKTYMTCCLIVV
jgi:hypothetical protein